MDYSDDSQIINDRFYVIRKLLKTNLIKQKQQFIPSVPFVYHPNGIPILFKKSSFSREDYINEARSMEQWYTIDDEGEHILKRQ